MLLQPLHWCLVLQAISSAFGRLEIKNSSSLPPSSSYGTLSTVDPDLKATPSSTSIHGLSTTDDLSFNASSTVLSSLPHHVNLTGEDAGYPHARNDGYDVRIMGADTYELQLRNGKLDFDLSQASACNGRILACFESGTSTSSMKEDPRLLCADISSSYCGFQADISPIGVSFMGRATTLIQSFFAAQKCQISMTLPGFEVNGTSYDSCIPTITEGSVKLVVKTASDFCPLIVKGAQLKPKELSTTATINTEESTTEASSSAATIWIVVSCIIFAFALLGLVVFAIWFFKLRHRKAKPAKTQPAPTEVADPTAKVQTQVQVKDEIKNDDAVVAKKDLIPVKSESKLQPPAVVKSKVDELAKVKAVEAAREELKTTQDIVGQPTDALPTRNEQIVARAKSAMKTFSLRSGKSAKSGQKKPDSALLRLQASNEYRKLAPIHSLSRVYEIHAQSAKEIAQLYPPGRTYSDDVIEIILLSQLDVAMEVFDFISADARKLLIKYGAEFDMKGNAIKVPELVRQLVRNDGTEEHLKAYLFLAEYGKDFEPTPDILPKLSAPLLFVVAMGTRYSDQLRAAAIVEMRRHLPIIRKCWSYEERQKCHFPINGIEQARKLNKYAFRYYTDLKSDSSSSGRKAALKRQKQRETAERANKHETRR